MNPTAILLLAAGASVRMGQPKQLLDFQGKKLVQIVLERLLACRCFPTVAVLGAHASLIAPYCGYSDLNVIQNPNWHTGMASSIRCGIEFLEVMFPDVAHAMIALVDQPHVEAEHYYALLEASEAAPDKVVAAYYADQIGVPMVFPRRFFPLLARLRGDQGARAVARELPSSEVIRVSLPLAAVDWDSPSDLGRMD